MVKRQYINLKLLRAMIVAFIIVFAYGCGKKTANIPVLTYNTNDDGTLTITGLTDKGKSDAVVNIPAAIDGKQVKAIERGAFKDNHNLNKVTIENGITKISENAFLNCSNLSEILIPESVSEIGTNAFCYSKWANSLLDDKGSIIINKILVMVKLQGSDYVIPDGIEAVGSGVFYENKEIESVSCPDSLKTIGLYAFSGCTSLKNIYFGNNLEYIQYAAFSGCSELSVNIPLTVSKIDNEAFTDVKEIQYAGKAQGSPWGAKSLKK